MPSNKRFKTKYPGVYYVESAAIGSNKTERVFYIRYRKGGRSVEEKAGRQFQDDMTPARAATLRGKKIEGAEKTNIEKREQAKREKLLVENTWTVDHLWKEYKKTRKDNKALKTDEGRYKLYIEKPLGSKELSQIFPLDIDRIRIKHLKNKSPQTVKHILGIIKRINNFALNKGLAPGLSFRIQMPKVDNEKTEDLNSEQLSALFKAIDESNHFIAASMMKTALFTGMRRGEMFKLKWQDIDFDRGFIFIKDPKGGKSQKVPLNQSARHLFETMPKISEFVFPGRNGGQRVDINKAVNEIKNAAGLPRDFRPLHGLRHVYASMLASSGKVDMYTLQKLLTHKSPQMTQRYAHLRDKSLKEASDIASELLKQSSTS